MIICRVNLQAAGHTVPAAGIIPENPLGGVVLVHGYGGCKEEVLGLAWRLAEQSMAVCAIDLPGHGENQAPLDENILEDIEAAMGDWQRFGQVVLVGQSLGGRLGLLSSAKFVIAISPPLGPEVGRSLRFPLKNMRSHRVKGNSFEDFLKIFSSLAPSFDQEKNRLIILGDRDFKEVSESCFQVRQLGIPVRIVNKALHGDVFLKEETITIIAEQIRHWIS